MPPQIHVGDVGTAFQYACVDQAGAAIDVSTASVQIVFQLPSQASLTKTATFVNTGTDGQVQYVSQAGDLSAPGTWHAQVYLNFGGTLFHSDKTTFRVFPNIV